jgi:genome maintenance exonuclease 1
MFNHCPPKQLLELTTENVNGKRYYLTPNGHYPSITSVLSAFPKPALMEWKESVGEKEANRISTLAANKGTKFHSLCEQYLLNDEINKKEYMVDSLSRFYEFKPILNRINNIHKLEVPLYSEKLMVAGRTDCIGNFDEILSIVDFKTSAREKREEWIEDYFLQATFYHIAYWELTGIKTKQLVILISVEDGENQIFIKDPKEYIPKIIKKIKYYYNFLHNQPL